MRKITTFLGCVGVVGLFWGCSAEDDLLSPNGALAEIPAISSAIQSETTSSSSVAAPGNTDPGVVTPGNQEQPPTQDKPDTTVIHKPVTIIEDNTSKAPSPNYLEIPVFCWTDECKANPPVATSSSSAVTIDIGMSQEAQEPPTISGNTMTDNRDGNSYKLQNVAGKLWTADNMKYKTSTGTFCEDNSGTDVCAKYGGFYTYTAAHRVCPGGWRLPTPAEAEAANAAAGHKWWTVGGRFKLTTSGEVESYGLAGEQGYLWLESDGNNNAWRIEDYSGKELEEATQASDRAFNVRCVQSDPE